MTEKIGEQIKKWRLELGLSLREMAEKAGMDYGHLWKIEQGKVIPRKKTIAALEKVVRLHSEQKYVKDLIFDPGINYISDTTLKQAEQTVEEKTQIKIKLVQKVIKIMNNTYNYVEIAAAINAFLDLLENQEITEDKALDLLIAGYYSYLSKKNNQG
jgi:transcriptional regulator with XRE-family HTH domain